jgi:protein-L-isoaspartate(D-aspartate) O-methyltransferase
LKHWTNFEDQRLNMVNNQIRYRGIIDKNVINAMESVPRHLFVGENEQRLAYIDGPLPIGHGQTISQPYIVAYMTEILELQPHHKVLEIGTGCGYQTAILSLIAKQVISIEYIEGLAKSARNRLNNLGYKNISIHCSNGRLGWQKEAPYDRIIGTAAPSKIPEPLIEQLAPSGIMILPVGKSVFDQALYIVSKNENNKVAIKQSLGVRFVPMVG